MYNEQEQTFTGSATGDIISPSHPVLAENASIKVAHRINTHRHLRGQFIFSSRGTINLSYADTQWYFNSEKIAWIPSGYAHSVRSAGPVEYCSLFIDASVCPELSHYPTIFQLTPLIKELTHTAATFSYQYKPDSAESRLIAVLFDQLKWLSPSRLNIPLPSDPVLRANIQPLLEQPSIKFNTPWLAELCHMSTRSLERHFKSQTGISFGHWLRRVVILNAIDQIKNGCSIKKTALQLGYRNASAFTAMFRRELGQSPSAYFS